MECEDHRLLEAWMEQWKDLVESAMMLPNKALSQSVFHKALWSLEKQSRRGFRGYPLATVAFYGPDDQRATKVAVGIIPAEGAEADPLQRWFSEHTDARSDPTIARQIGEFLETHAASR